jgi:site-specific DNA recombinase
VIAKIKEHVLTTDNLRRLVKIVNENLDTLSPEYRQDLERVMNEIADVGRLLERYDALETGQIKLADLAPRIEQLRLRKEQLQATHWDLKLQLSERQIELANDDTVAACVAELRELLY